MVEMFYVEINGVLEENEFRQELRLWLQSESTWSFYIALVLTFIRNNWILFAPIEVGSWTFLNISSTSTKGNFKGQMDDRLFNILLNVSLHLAK
jgi:hypothetical protein